MTGTIFFANFGKNGIVPPCESLAEIQALLFFG